MGEEMVEVVYRTTRLLYGQHESGRQFSIMHRDWFLEHSFTCSPHRSLASSTTPSPVSMDHGDADVVCYVDD